MGPGIGQLPGSLIIARLIIALLVLLAPGCRCAGGVTFVPDAELAVSPAALQFHDTWVGKAAELPVEVSNHARVKGHLEVTLEGEGFSTDAWGCGPTAPGKHHGRPRYLLLLLVFSVVAYVVVVARFEDPRPPRDAPRASRPSRKAHGGHFQGE